MGLGHTRIRALYGILHKAKGMHRYTRWRWVIGILGTVGIALLPLTDTLRFDLWRGQHHYLGKQVSLVEAARRFVFPFLAINIGIILMSRVVGRYLCGFACPIGSLGRLGEWARYAERKAHHRLLTPLVLLLVSATLSAITFSFWIDWAVFVEGSPRARLVSGALLAGLTAGLYLLVSRAGLGFCQTACPSGVYFAVLGQDSTHGIEYDKAACTDCGVCTTVCPMDLDPKDMSGGKRRGARGLYGEFMSNFALCIRCGDCVVGCEELGTRGQPKSALRMGALPPDLRDSSDPSHRQAGGGIGG